MSDQKFVILVNVGETFKGKRPFGDKNVFSD